MENRASSVVNCEFTKMRSSGDKYKVKFLGIDGSRDYDFPLRSSRMKAAPKRRKVALASLKDEVNTELIVEAFFLIISALTVNPLRAV